MSQFDYELYVNLYPDLKENEIDSPEKLLTHWINHGKDEERVNNVFSFIQKYKFDYSFYTNYYKLKNIQNIRDAIMNWILIGQKLGRVVNKNSLPSPKKDKKEKKGKKEEKKNKILSVNNPLVSTLDDNFYKLKNYFNLEFLKENKVEISLCKINYDKNVCKGINIDLDILRNSLSDLKFPNLKDIFIEEKDFGWLSNNALKRKIEVPLDSEYYIFSEVILFDLCVYLLSNYKKVIIIPNIDSYDTFSVEKDWFENLKHLNTFSNFHIWSKTKQIYNWMEKHEIKNNTFLNFLFYKTSLSRDIPINKENHVLLDTGSSLTDRKYLTEIANIFHSYNVGFKLVIKTVPCVYEKKKLYLYKDSKNIMIVNKLMTMKELNNFYNYFEYFIYLAKFDGFGLSLSKAMSYNMYIFAGNGLPWSEILNHYPRKCLIEMKQDFTKGNGQEGYSKSQIYYKCNFSDLIYKLKNIFVKKEKYKEKHKVIFYNWLNKNIYLSNLYRFFNNNSYYNQTAVHLCSFKDRMIILLENLVQMIFQTRNINIYLNSYCQYALHFLLKMNNVNIIPFSRDMKALSKLYCLGNTKFDSIYNFIIDDDIVYPSDYIEYSCGVMDKSDIIDTVYSYNGFFRSNKLSFMKKHHPNLNGQEIDILGTGTVFFKGTSLLDKEKLLRELKLDSDRYTIFADKFFSNFLKKNDIKKCYYNSKQFKWMINNSKIVLNKIPGLYEYKIQNNLIQESFIGVSVSSSISLKNVLYYVSNNNSMTETEISETSKLKKLSSFLYIKVVSNIQNLEVKKKNYDFLIVDTRHNLSNENSQVKIINLKNKNESTTTTIHEFIYSL